MTTSPPHPRDIDPSLADVSSSPSQSAPRQLSLPPDTLNPFPTHSGARAWFLSAGNTPVSVVLARALLEHGDKVVAGVYPPEHERAETRKEDFRALLRQVQDTRGWKERFKIVAFDIRSVRLGDEERRGSGKLLARSAQTGYTIGDY